MSPSLALAIAGVLVLINAGFVAAEFAFVTVRRTRIEALVRAGSRRARMLEAIVNDLDAHISAVQLAITSVGIGIGWLAEPAFAGVLEGFLHAAGIGSDAIVGGISFAVAFAVITVIVIVAGELTPKFLGLRRTESVALWSAPVVYWFARFTRPLLQAMNSAARGLLRMLGVGDVAPAYDKMDVDEMRIFLSELSKFGRLSVSRKRMLENVFDFAEHSARQIMVPRDRIDFLSLDRPIEENLAIVSETGHTRYPLCESGLDSVVGMVHIKDLYQRASTINASDDLRLIQHDMLFVPESQPIDMLQNVFQKARSHMAVVVDEYGVPTGLVTMEDVLEELVGEIRDEFDTDEVPKIERTDDGLRIDGMLLIEDLCHELDADIEGNGADTLGGHITNTLGRIPRVNDRFKLDRWDGRVLEMQGRRVARVLLRDRKKSKDARASEERRRAAAQPAARDASVGVAASAKASQSRDTGT